MRRLLRILLDPRWVFILPVVHLAGCIVTQITNSAWMPVIMSEFPVSLILIGIAWRFGYPLFWFGVFGTLVVLGQLAVF